MAIAGAGVVGSMPCWTLRARTSAVCFFTAASLPRSATSNGVATKIEEYVPIASPTNSASLFFQAEDGIREAQESRGLGDVYKRQTTLSASSMRSKPEHAAEMISQALMGTCLLYTSDAADDLTRVDLGGRRLIK